MSNGGAHRAVRTIALPWRKTYAVFPAVALIGGGIAMAAPASDVKSIAIAKTVTAVAVPGAALSMPAVPAGAGTRAPRPALPKGAAPGSSALGLLDGRGIPARDRAAYRRGASLVSAAALAWAAKNVSAPRPSPPAGEGTPVASRASATTPTSPPSLVSALPLPALPISGQRPTPSGLPPLPLSGEDCTVSRVGLRTCLIAP